MEQNKKTVFIVDDDKFLVTLYQKKFAIAGWDASVAQSATEALQKLRDGFAPSAIVFDIIMPAVDGIAFVETIKKEKLAPHTALVALTNQGQEDGTIEKVKALGVAGYIVKASLIPSEVVEMVQKIVDARKK